jgi:hypothetical protein
LRKQWIIYIEESTNNFYNNKSIQVNANEVYTNAKTMVDGYMKKIADKMNH